MSNQSRARRTEGHQQVRREEEKEKEDQGCEENRDPPPGDWSVLHRGPGHQQPQDGRRILC